MSSADTQLRELVAQMPVPDFDHHPWTLAPPLAEATVALVTTAGLHRRGDTAFELFDQSFRLLHADERDLIVGHNSLNFDRTGLLADLNVVYPVDRLGELAADGTVGAVGPRHIAFMGAQMDTLTTISLDTGPAAAAALRGDGVDIAVITTVCPFCPRTACAIARSLEANGIATVVLNSIRTFAERMTPPRALYCEFPLGRPLGRPNDPALQRDVLLAALRLLDRPSGPVLEDYPEVVTDRVDDVLACAVPPRHDPSLPASVDEARALRPAFDRGAHGGLTSVEDPAAVEAAIEAFERIAAGEAWSSAGLEPNPLRAAGLVAAYYQQAAVGLADHVPDARQAETWYATRTETAATIRRAQQVMQDQGAPEPIWFYLLPATQQGTVPPSMRTGQS
jgi:D-proline reductase (dithiol) PrdB